MKKVKAFTVMEVLVVAILSVLIASAAFSVIQIFNQQYSDYEKDHSISADLDEMYSWMQWDCYTSEKMVVQDGNLIFENGERTVLYRIDKDGIRRVLMNSNKLLMKFLTRPSNIITFLGEEEKQRGLVDYASLNFTFFDRTTQVVLKKEYSAKELISIDAN